MSKPFGSFFFFFWFTIAHGQVKPKGIPFPSKQEFGRSERNRNCEFRKRYSAAQRLTMFPFSRASAVQLVSFENPAPFHDKRLPIKNGDVAYSMLKEVKALNKQGIDSLTNILYNNGYRGKFTIADMAQCYIPRNAILFTDTTGNAFAFIELCFECGRSKVSSQKIETGDFCTQKYELLKNFFAQQGIVLGTKDNDETETDNR